MGENSIFGLILCLTSRQKVYTYIVFWIVLTKFVRAIDTCPCNQLTCNTPVNCTHGVVPDKCSCCLVCARGVGETCDEGGESNGICAHGLQCFIGVNAGDPVTEKRHGFCKVLPESCNSSACESSVKHRCPDDSVLVYKSTQWDNECCQPTYECRCNPKSCDPEPKCPHGHTPHILHHSSDRPGSCCNQYYCQASGCWSQTKYYSVGETWKEGDCVTCSCINNTKQCQAEMCMKRCLSPRYVPGRCCPICESPSLYPNQSLSKCPSLSTCNITCQTGLLQTPDGCHVCLCKPEACFKDCPYGYVYDENGNKLCECLSKSDQCPALDTCSKLCSHGYKVNKNGCPKCRCNKCSPLSCTTRCFVGYKTDKYGCNLCKCQDKAYEKNCTMNNAVFTAGQTWVYNCTSCSCGRDATVVCEQMKCPLLKCTHMTRLPGECCPTCHISGKFMAEDEVDLKDVEMKYIISLSIVGTLVIILLILVFVLLYLKLKQRHQASWSITDQDRYCKCPLFIGQSPPLQNKYDINDKLNYDQVLITKYQPCVTVNDHSPVDKNVFFPDENKNKDYNITDMKQPYIKGNGWADL